MIIFLSDTQFDRIADTTRGCLPGDYLKKKFEEIGQKAPLCCFWNLNGKVINSPAEPSDKGIVMMSGYSHTMLNSLVETITAASQASFEELKEQRAIATALYEEERRKEAEEAEETKQLNTFQLMLDFCEGDFGMNLREKLSELKTGIFTEYKYEKVLDEITV
jgi:DNA-directed RNA polymerase subunit L